MTNSSGEPGLKGKPSLGGLGEIRRRSVRVAQGELVRTCELVAGSRLPLVVEPALDGVDVASWLQNQRDWLAGELRHRGGVLLRGFALRTEEQLEDLASIFSGGQLLDYTYRSTPRTKLRGKVYTSTEYPANQSIPMHNEMSYSRSWPLKIWFFCMKPADEMGETPIADSRRVFERIDPEVRRRFIDRKVMYVRNYGEGLDLPWRDVFQTDDRGEVEAFCRKEGIEVEWKSGGRMRTRQICQSIGRHPETGEMVWFNQAHLFHVSSLLPEARELLLEMLAPDEVPRNAFYGDGSPIEESALEEIRRVYEQESVVFPWQTGDVLLLDNMLTAHGRRPFKGARKVVVAMAEPFSAVGV